MAKKKDYNKEKIRKLNEIIMALVTIYGPLPMDDLVDKIEYYFPKQFKYLPEEDLFAMIWEMANQNLFYVNEDDLVSMYTDEELKELLSLEDIKVFYDLDVEKEFDDPEEILKFTNLFHMKDCEEFDALRDFIDHLDFKDENDREKAFSEAVIIEFNLLDYEKYIDQMQDRINGPLTPKWVNSISPSSV